MGTDPAQGAALAQAILEQLLVQGVKSCGHDTLYTSQSICFYRPKVRDGGDAHRTRYTYPQTAVGRSWRV